MSDEQAVDLWALSDLETPWAIRVVATLGIAEHIAAGIVELNPLAKAAECDAESLGRVLRHLVGKGLFAEPAPARFALNAPAAALADPMVRIGLNIDGFGGRMAGAWSSLLAAVRTGRPAYANVFGQPFWEDLGANPAVAADFDALMGPGHGVPDGDVLLNDDWDAVEHVVDVGGGTGMLLAEVLRAHPPLRGTLVDLPRTVARAGAVFGAAGVSERASVVGQSFFDPLPSGADLYLLKNVLADWPDAEALAILRRCAEAAAPGGRVVVLGGASPGGETSAAPPELLMLVLLGGKGRTLSEFRVLAEAAGLVVTASGALRNGRFAVECRARD